MDTQQRTLKDHCLTLPFILKNESDIFFDKSSSHFILRVPTLGNLVIKETSHGSSNLTLFIEKLTHFSSHIDPAHSQPILFSTLHLVTRISDFKRVCERGGACIFRDINEVPRDIPNHEMMSIKDALATSSYSPVLNF